jgi:hypothetical protein
MTLTLRKTNETGATNKGSTLTHEELDANFVHLKDSANLDFTQSGSGAIARSMQDKGREIISRADYDNATNFNTAKAAYAPATVSAGGPFVANMVYGALPASGTVNVAVNDIAFTGDPSGNSDIIGYTFSVSGTGTEAIARAIGGRMNAAWNGTATGDVCADLRGQSAGVSADGAGPVTDMVGFASRLGNTGDGGTTWAVDFKAMVPSQTGAGLVATHSCFSNQNIGHVNINLASVFHAAPITTSPNIRAFWGEIAQGGIAGRYNFIATGTAYNWFQGYLGIGDGGAATPDYPLHIEEESTNLDARILLYHSDNTTATTHALLQLLTGGASGGDPYVQFHNSVIAWSAGSDNSDSDKFKISQGTALGTNDRLTITSAGVMTIPNLAGTGSRTVVADENGVLSAP